MNLILRRLGVALILSLQLLTVGAQTPSLERVLLYLKVDPDKDYLEGRAELRSSNLTQSVWELDALGLEVLRVEGSYFNLRLPLPWKLENNRLVVRWDSHPADGLERRLYIRYRARPEEFAFDRLKKDLKREGLVMSNPNPPEAADPLLSGAAAYIPWAATWAPLPDRPGVRFALTLALHLPENIDAEASGRLDQVVDDGKFKLLVYESDRQSPATIYWALGREKALRKQEEVLVLAAEQANLERLELERRRKQRRLEEFDLALEQVSGRLSARTGKTYRWSSASLLVLGDTLAKPWWQPLYLRYQAGELNHTALEQILGRRWMADVLGDTASLMARLAIKNLGTVEPETDPFRAFLEYDGLRSRGVTDQGSALQLFLSFLPLLNEELTNRFWKDFFAGAPASNRYHWVSQWTDDLPAPWPLIWKEVLNRAALPAIHADYRFVAAEGVLYLNLTSADSGFSWPLAVSWTCGTQENLKEGFLLPPAEHALPCGRMPTAVQVDPGRLLPVKWTDRRPEMFLLGQLQNPDPFGKWEAYGILLKSTNRNLRSTVMGIALDETEAWFRRLALQAATEELDAAGMNKLRATLERIAEEDPEAELREMARELLRRNN